MHPARPEDLTRWDFGAWPASVAAAIAGLNLFDCLFTTTFVQLGACTEANPVMRLFLCISPALFAAIKLAMVQLGLLALVRWSDRLIAQIGLALGLVVYVALVAFELHTAALVISLL